MISIRRSEERGKGEHGWLSSRHSFSFADYFDPQHMGFGPLRVINEDRVAPGGGFPTHGHRDMEIISYVLAGALEHRDSLGTGAVIRPGEIQRMTAGRGIRHSEFNASAAEPVHFLQIWIEPESTGLEPGYEQKSVPVHEEPGRLHLIASRGGRDGSVTIHRDVDLYGVALRRGDRLVHELRPGRVAWLQVARGGSLAVNDAVLAGGDAVAIREENAITVVADAAGEVLLFDMAA